MNAPGHAGRFRLPDGSLTNSADYYVTRWRELTDPLEELGMSVIAYDPGVLVSFNGRSLSLPLVLVRLLVELVERRQSDQHASRAVAR